MILLLCVCNMYICQVWYDQYWVSSIYLQNFNFKNIHDGKTYECKIHYGLISIMLYHW